MRPFRFHALLPICAALGFGAAAHADVMDDCFALRRAWDGALLDLHGGRSANLEAVAQAESAFGGDIRTPEATAAWNTPANASLGEAGKIGWKQGRLQAVLALEMIDRQHSGDLQEARKWRALLQMPKHADAVQGALALQKSRGAQKDEVSRLLARESLLWNNSLVREKADALRRLVSEGRTWPSVVEARGAEIAGLAQGAPGLFRWVGLEAPVVALPSFAHTEAVQAWTRDVVATLPDLLKPEDVTRRERLIVKLLRLVPVEYSAGVRDGEIVIPIEYREAKTFTVQSRQLVDELQQTWQREKAEAWTANQQALEAKLEELEKSINEKAAPREVEALAKAANAILQDKLGIAAKRSGKTTDVIADTAMEVRGLLKDSLQAARQSRWRDAESLRLEAYTTFDLEIEARVLPRDPDLALKVERMFLDGDGQTPGIKEVLDQHSVSQNLEAAYGRALAGVDECIHVLEVGLSPAAAIYTTVSIVAREGLEAVVILAALLAGLRGPENRKTRRLVGTGAWLALVAAGLTFLLSRFLIESLSRYGEKLEAVVSVLAVVILLMVTNWVFHKVYWTGWNARLRSLSKAVDAQGESRWSGLAMVGVGFLTIYREGFETVLFLQSLILEAGFLAVLAGLGIGVALVGALGIAVFAVGRKLPYRKMLVYTGVLVVTVLVTFLGSTVRLFQTVGWMPIHPIHGLEMPSWVGIWFGLYPSWEGILIPLFGFVYVGGAWLWVKWQSRKGGEAELAHSDAVTVSAK